MTAESNTIPRHSPEAFLAAVQQAWERQADSPAPASLRDVARARLVETGFPALTDEDWRFTPLTPLWRLGFHPAAEAGHATVIAPALESLPFSHQSGPRVVFVNGRHVPALSRIDGLPPGVTLGAISRLLESGAAGLADDLTRGADRIHNSFDALNAASFTDGLFVSVDEGCRMQEPVHAVFLTTTDRAGGSSQIRNLIRVGRDAGLTVMEQYASLNAAGHFTNVTTDLTAGDGSRLEHLKLQDENPASVHLATLNGEFGRHSRVWMHSVALGARLSRNSIRVRLAGEGLEAVLNGLYLTRQDQLADHHMLVEHAEPHCASHEYFNGILDDRSRGVFHGRIYVHPVAQKTDAKQTNKNLLLSSQAVANTKPQLEIYADDVKCTHGATIGQLSREAIFYLRSRGIGTETARRMLIHAFAGEIIERIQAAAIRDELDRIVWNRLEQNPHIGDAGV